MPGSYGAPASIMPLAAPVRPIALGAAFALPRSYAAGCFLCTD
jgi:hypothetical protein